jgi:DNA (cytosine-5)-methyltransferase 1
MPKNKKQYKLVDLFAGTGAFSYAFERTNDVKCVYANDFCKNSEKIYNLNHKVKLSTENLNDVDVKDIPKHNILCGGFPCFVSGTKVLTNDGYKCIEDVIIEDKLGTHTGKFQNIVNLQRKIYSGKLYKLEIKYHPHIITCTKEHPFYVKEKKRIWNNNLRKYDITFDKPKWKMANKLTKNDYFGMVINTNEIVPEFIIDDKIIRIDSPYMWFMMGYFFGNNYIEKINEYDDSYWFNILKQFGKYAHGKLIPEWVQDAPKKYVQEFINGYMKADGCILKDNILQITTVSCNLAYGLQRLYLKLGHIFSVNKCIRPKTTVIEGRTVNQRDTYTVRGKLNKMKECGFIKDNYVWFPSKNISTVETINTPVYNFEVKNDNSYIVENIICHNCQPFSISGKQEGFKDPRANVFWKILEILKHHKPDIVVLENVKNLVSHDNGKTFKTIYSNLKKLKYHIKYQVLNTSIITNVPQGRERIYIVCFKDKKYYDKFDFDFPEVKNKSIKSFLEKNPDNKYYYTNKLKVYDTINEGVTESIDNNVLYQYRRYYVRENKSNVCPTLTANMGSGGHNVPLLKDNKGIRKLTPRECFNLQGFPKNYKLPDISDSGLYKLAGNAVSVPVVQLLANNITKIIDL